MTFIRLKDEKNEPMLLNLEAVEDIHIEKRSVKRNKQIIKEKYCLVFMLKKCEYAIFFDSYNRVVGTLGHIERMINLNRALIDITNLVEQIPDEK